MRTRNVLRVTAVSTALVLVGSGVSYAALTAEDPSASSTDGATDSAVVASHANHKHGGQGGHLEGSNDNLTLIGQMRINQDVEGRVADVAVHEGHAYLAAFNERDCQKGGVYVFDIQDPTAPKQINFIRTANNSYVGEGAQVLSLDTEHFTGDLLIHNNEICSGGGNGGGTSHAVGGISLVDVTDPKTHKGLALGFGDTNEGAQARAHQVHSAFAWQDGDKAYAVMVDNEESTDIDIVDITDPRAPELIAEYDLVAGKKIVDGGPPVASGIPDVSDGVKGPSEAFLHDMVVKEIDGVQTMLVSYWDGGYVTLDVDDPREASYIGDTDFEATDTELDESLVEQGKAPEGREPEGNAHQAEFSGGNDTILAADEDFAPFSFVASGERVGEFDANSGDGTTQLPPGEPLTAQTVYVGRACTGDVPVPDDGAGKIALVERGVCTFTEKVANVSAAGGYAGVLIFNREGSDACRATLGMSVVGDLPAFGTISRETGYDLLGIKDEYDDAACEAATPQATVSEPYTPIADLGTLGDTVTFESYFDGWGYVRLIQNEAGKMTELDTFAIPEAHQQDKAVGFGDLSVHEIAFSEKNPDLAYVSYYSGGTRVLDISSGTIQEVGHWIDEGGSNIWGVQVFEHEGKEYVASSDRDFGVQIFEYTGPGAPNAAP